MASIIVKKGTVRITEKALRQVLAEIDRVKDIAADPELKFEFTEEPIPDWDMDPKQYQKEKAKRYLANKYAGT